MMTGGFSSQMASNTVLFSSHGVITIPKFHSVFMNLEAVSL